MLLSSILSQFYKEFNAHSNSAPLSAHSPHSSDEPVFHTLATRAQPRAHTTFFVVAACLIPVLVIFSGIFAGLTLGYMSLDETQLTVLASSGTA
jgi:metal transporter CNNM